MNFTNGHTQITDNQTATAARPVIQTPLHDVVGKLVIPLLQELITKIDNLAVTLNNAKPKPAQFKPSLTPAAREKGYAVLRAKGEANRVHYRAFLAALAKTAQPLWPSAAVALAAFRKMGGKLGTLPADAVYAECKAQAPKI